MILPGLRKPNQATAMAAIPRAMVAQATMVHLLHVHFLCVVSSPPAVLGRRGSYLWSKPCSGSYVV